MATPADIRAQLQQTKTLLTGGASGPTLDAMARNIETQISMMSELSLAEAPQLVQEIVTVGFSPDWQDRLQNATLQRAMHLSNRQAAAANGTQQLLNPLEFLTCKDWAAMEAIAARLTDTVPVLGAHLGEVAEIICNRAGAGLRITHPSEKTVRGFAAIAATVLFPNRMPTAHESLAVFKEIKTGMKARDVMAPSSTGRLTTYPPSPAGLPAPLFQSAYPDPADPPVSKTLARFFVVQSVVACRDSKAATAGVAKAAGGSSNAGGANAISALLGLLGNDARVNALLGNAITAGSPADGRRADKSQPLSIQWLGGGGPRRRSQPAALADAAEDSPQTTSAPPATAGDVWHTAVAASPATAEATSPSQASLATGELLPPPGVVPPAPPSKWDPTGVMSRMKEAAGGDPGDKSAKKVLKRPAAAASSLDAKRLAKGPAYNDAYDKAYDKAIKAGKDHKHALQAAQKAGQVAASLES